MADSPSPSKPSDPQKRLFDNDEAATQAYAVSDTDSEPEEEPSKGIIPATYDTSTKAKKPKRIHQV